MRRARLQIRPGLTLLLGASLLLGAASSAACWVSGVSSLGGHLLTSVPMFYFLFICIHDGVHGVLSRRRWLNTGAATVFAAGVGLPFALLRHAHLLHHATVGEARDPESAVYAAPLSRLPLMLLLVPMHYLRLLPRLSRPQQALVVAQLLAWLVLLWAAPVLLAAWVLPILLAIVWFGLTTVYAPHSAHQDALMRFLRLHSGYHHDHHRDARYPFHQYFQLRLDGLLNRGVAPGHRGEIAVLRLATLDLRTGQPSVRVEDVR